MYNPLTRKAELNIKRDNKSSDMSDEDLQNDQPKLSADQMIAELLSDKNDEDENIKIVTDTLSQSSKLVCSFF